MNARRAVFAAVLLTIAGSGGPLVAHHSFSMFEMDKNVTYKGVVVEYKWINPHVHFTIDIKPGAGVDQATVGRWDVEGGSTNIMGAPGLDARHAEARRPDHAGRAPDEGRLQGHLALLHDQARRQAHVSRHRPPEGRGGTVGNAMSCYSRREFAKAALSGVALRSCRA